MSHTDATFQSTPFETDKPRYLAVAETLAQAIRRGEYVVGDLLPTEQALCQQFSASRHTIREALKKLSEIGLVSRYQGVGTRVKSIEVPGRYVAYLNSIQDMWRHVEQTRSKVLSKTIENREQALFTLPRFEGDEVWHRLDVLRSGQFDDTWLPLSMTHVYINDSFRGIVDMVDSATVPIFSLIERRYGQRVVRVKQEISGTLLDVETAKVLQVKPGTPGLSIIRVYMGPRDVVFQAAQSIYPADRFKFELDLRLELGRE
ncbi:MAG: GntR family transcriptional regulator [Lautropia sp.]